MDRLDRLLKDELYRGYLDKNAAAEKNRKFCRHDFQHLVDVARIAYILLLETGEIRSFMEENDFNLRLARKLFMPLPSCMISAAGRNMQPGRTMQRPAQYWLRNCCKKRDLMKKKQK